VDEEAIEPMSDVRPDEQSGGRVGVVITKQTNLFLAGAGKGNLGTIRRKIGWVRQEKSRDGQRNHRSVLPIPFSSSANGNERQVVNRPEGNMITSLLTTEEELGLHRALMRTVGGGKDTGSFRFFFASKAGGTKERPKTKALSSLAKEKEPEDGINTLCCWSAAPRDTWGEGKRVLRESGGG